MDTTNRNAVLLASLPKGWKALAMQKFAKSRATIENIAYGTSENLDVMEYLVSLAEQEKIKRTKKQAELDSRLKALAGS